jgi:hypothetical protein
VANPAGSAAPEIALDAPEHVAAAPLGQAPNGPLNVASARPGTPVTGGRSAAPSPAAKTAPRLYAGIALGARNVASGVSVVSLHRGHLDAFYRGTDNGLWHQWVDTWTGGWVAPERLGSFTFTATPAAVSWADGRIDVMLRGTDGHLYQVVWDGTWHLEAYELTPGGQHADLAGSPAITSRHSGHLDVYWRNSSHHLMHYWIDNRYSPDWQGPEALGGSTQMSSDPAVESSNDYRTDVFARSSRNGLMHMHWGDGGGWTAWSLVPGVSNVAWTPTAVYQRGSSFPRNVLVAYLGTDGQLWRVESRDSSSWARAVPLSGASVAAPGAASWANGRVDVLFRDAQGLLRQKFYDGTWHL